MKIELNYQQATFLKDFLNFHINENEWISNTSKGIMLQIEEQIQNILENEKPIEKIDSLENITGSKLSDMLGK